MPAPSSPTLLHFVFLCLRRRGALCSPQSAGGASAKS
uniref:Uncharacterized protein n=1 Tax=Arundo donax TaxID=35708 RepID=A0A0A8YJQ6_ARUDO